MSNGLFHLMVRMSQTIASAAACKWQGYPRDVHVPARTRTTLVWTDAQRSLPHVASAPKFLRATAGSGRMGSMSVSVNDVLVALRDTALDERDKGDKFERLVLNPLRTEPEWVSRFSDVWLWSDWPASGTTSPCSCAINRTAKATCRPGTRPCRKAPRRTDVAAAAGSGADENRSEPAGPRPPRPNQVTEPARGPDRMERVVPLTGVSTYHWLHSV